MKKQQGAINLFQAQQQATSQYNVGSGSDSDPSPSFTSPEYLAMMQQWAPEQQLGMGMAQTQQYQEQAGRTMHSFPVGLPSDQFHRYDMAQHLGDDTFNSPEEMNRRTMTQEQFDAMARSGGVVNGQDDFGNPQGDFSTDSAIWNTMFADSQGHDIKPQEAFAFPHAFGAPMSSYDSTVPSTISDQSMPAFPSSNQMQNRVNLSASSSEWSGSRSSSICVSQPGESMMQAAQQHQQQSAVSTSQWQPGQSVPVDFNALNEEFRQAAQARDRQQGNIHEQPLAWPADDAFQRSDSQATNMLAQSLRNVDIHTPQPIQSATFKSPAPPANIAARRQRRPAPIGMAAMRSQSYSGTAPPPISPSRAQHQSLPPGQQVRRIRSSNMINGAGIAHGRIMKSGSAQRSPLSFTFADAMNSPRHVSGQSTLAPPTPMTPQDFSGQESGSQFPSWNASSGHATRHPSINETELEHEVPPASSSVPAQNFSSPPHTPSFYQHQFAQQRVGNNVITQNTPPQSAPASQLCFPSNTYAQIQQQQQQSQHQHSISQPYAHPAMAMAATQSQPSLSSAAPSQPSALQTVTFAPTQHAPVTSGPPPGVPLQFANGIPMVDDEGNITIAFPAPMQFLPEQQQQPMSHFQQMPTPPQQHYPYMTSATASPNAQITAHLPKQSQQPAQEFFVHEYSPPEELKRSATPRKAIDNAPKNYTFANSGPEHWEKQAKKAEAKAAAAATASSSPAGSSTSAP